MKNAMSGAAKTVAGLCLATLLVLSAGCSGGEQFAPAEDRAPASWAVFSYSRQQYCLREENILPVEGVVEVRRGEVVLLEAELRQGLRLAELPAPDKGLETRVTGSGVLDDTYGIGLLVWSDVAGDFGLRFTGTAGESATVRIRVLGEDAPVKLSIRQNGLLLPAQMSPGGWPMRLGVGLSVSVRVIADQPSAFSERPGLAVTEIDSGSGWVEYQLTPQAGAQNTGQIVAFWSGSGGPIRLEFMVF